MLVIRIVKNVMQLAEIFTCNKLSIRRLRRL